MAYLGIRVHSYRLPNLDWSECCQLCVEMGMRA